MHAQCNVQVLLPFLAVWCFLLHYFFHFRYWCWMMIGFYLYALRCL